MSDPRGENIKCPKGEHEKVYDVGLLASNPPQQNLVCRKCKIRGRDVVGSYVDFHGRLREFDELCKESTGWEDA